MSLHCMIDLETLGNSHDAAIIQIGWCLFDQEKIFESGQRTVHFEDALKHGKVTPSTLAWWMQQSEEARKSVITPHKNDTLAVALQAFVQTLENRWGKEEHNGQRVEHFWAHATFDFTILSNAFKSVGIENPIGFRQCRDLRTLDMLADAATIENWPVREGVHHTAIDDAVHQAKCVQLMLKKINWRG